MDSIILQYRKYTEETKWHSIELKKEKNAELHLQNVQTEAGLNVLERTDNDLLDRFLCYEFCVPEGLSDAVLGFAEYKPVKVRWQRKIAGMKNIKSGRLPYKSLKRLHNPEREKPAEILRFSHKAGSCMPSEKDGFVFSDLDNFVCKIRFVITSKEGNYYSEPIGIKPENDEIKREMLLMSQKILESRPTLMVSVFQKSPLCVYLDKKSMVKGTIDTKLELMRRIIKLYHAKQSDLKRLPESVLVSHRYVDRIEKMTVMDSSTVSFIVQNPQYLVEVNRKKGIHYKEKVYLPSRTLVRKNIIQYDIYENQYILSFLDLLIGQCDYMKNHLILLIQDVKGWQKNELKKLNSQQADLETLLKKSERQLERVYANQKELKILKGIYGNIFAGMKDNGIAVKKGKPRSTAIFRQLPEYNVFYKEAFIPWFEYGVGDLLNPSAKAELYTTAIANPSTTYELYVVVKFLEYLEKEGYSPDAKKAKYSGINENISRYQDYAYEFVYHKDSDQESIQDEDENRREWVKREEITFFYSPSIFLRNKYQKYNADPLLYRNTEKSMARASDESNAKRGAHYDPDFIVKYKMGRYDEERDEWEKGSRVRFVMADAKHKDNNTVVEQDMPALYNKYINSIMISADALKKENLNPDAEIIGVCAVYNKHNEDWPQEKDQEEYFEDSRYSNKKMPFAKLLYLNVNDELSEEAGRITKGILDELRTVDNTAEFCNPEVNSGDIKADVIISLYKKGSISLDDAAAELGITKEKLEMLTGEVSTV